MFNPLFPLSTFRCRHVQLGPGAAAAEGDVAGHHSVPGPVPVHPAGAADRAAGAASAAGQEDPPPLHPSAADRPGREGQKVGFAAAEC
jgi:hypothetical protein